MLEITPTAGISPDQPVPVAPTRAAIKKMVPNEALVKQLAKFGGRALKLIAKLPK